MEVSAKHPTTTHLSHKGRKTAVSAEVKERHACTLLQPESIRADWVLLKPEAENYDWEMESGLQLCHHHTKV